MDDKNYARFALIAGGCALLYWLYQRKMNAENALQFPQAPQIPTDPMGDVYAADPDGFNPQSLGDVNINIANQGLGYLTNQYIPLFGFVGMAQGVYYQ